MSIRSISARAAVASLLLSTVILAACGGGSDNPPAAPPPNAISVLPVSGSTLGVTAVVLTGTDFVAGATVTVGGTAATMGAVTATTIAFTTPAHAAGAVDVVVRNPDGQTDTLTGVFTYVAPIDTVWVVPDAAVALTAPQRTAFTDGNLYVNAHTTANGAGEIRGQLDDGGTIKLASLSGAQETPAAITTSAYGAGVLQVDEVTGKVRGFVVTYGLVSPTVAHVHQAARGAGGPPIVDLVSAGSKDLWVVPDNAALLTGPQITAYQAGNLYFNVHTAANTGGEIRGQLDKTGTVKLASLNAAQEPAVTSTALGAGILVVNEGTGAVAGFAVTTGLSNVNNAHVHVAPRGTSAGVATAMTWAANSPLVVIADDAAVLSAANITAFQNDGLYFNVHTVANVAGEIRGQIDKTGTVRVAAMDGAQERATPVTTAALGAGLVAVDGTTGEVSGFIVTRGLVSPTIAHIHQAARGAAAGPIVDLARP